MTVALTPLQAALAAEHAVIYGYGVAGARLSGGEQALAMTSLHVHEARRDQLTSLCLMARVSPPVAAAAYQMPFAVTSASAARRLAAQLEAGGAGAAWDLLAASGAGGDARQLAIEWLADAAVRISQWGAAAPPLPGQPVAT